MLFKFIFQNTLQRYLIQCLEFCRMQKKVNRIWLALKIFYTLLIVVLLIGLVVAAFIMKGKWNLINLGFADIGVYGVVIFSFLILQQVFSILNNNWWVPKLVKKCNSTPLTNIQVVGYRQDPKLFRACLTSLTKQNYTNVGQILVGIDGNEDKDMKMAEVFQQVFPEGVSVKLHKVYEQMNQSQKALIKKVTFNHKYVCISQPHKGKRDIMYTCFHCHSDSTELISLTDSDTMWNQDTLKSLVDVMVGHDQYRKQQNQKQNKYFWQSQVKQCGSVTGDVGIWNKENYISYLSALRYWFAFNVQRAADSFFGVVNCVSGPLGLYKRHHLQYISEGWINQSFMGEKCTFGDDRNLSNRVLENDLCIFYTPYAKCQTDTPAQLLRWIPQQTRWCKSFYREFLYNVKSFYKHSVWMAVELVFQFVYPFFIIVTLVWFVTFSINLLLIVFSFIVLMGTFRGLFGFLRTGRIQFFHYSMYVFLYILFLIPSKLWALLTVWNSQWGTSSRLIRYQNILKAIHAVVWAVGLTVYMGFFFIKYAFFDKMKIQFATGLMSICCLSYILFLVIHWNLWGTCFLVPQVQNSLQNRYCRDKQRNHKRRNQFKVEVQNELKLSKQDEQQRHQSQRENIPQTDCEKNPESERQIWIQQKIIQNQIADKNFNESGEIKT